MFGGQSAGRPHGRSVHGDDTLRNKREKRKKPWLSHVMVDAGRDGESRVQPDSSRRSPIRERAARAAWPYRAAPIAITRPWPVGSTRSSTRGIRSSPLMRELVLGVVKVDYDRLNSMEPRWNPRKSSASSDGSSSRHAPAPPAGGHSQAGGVSGSATRRASGGRITCCTRKCDERIDGSTTAGSGGWPKHEDARAPRQRPGLANLIVSRRSA